jgi:hypothetical protein
MMGLKAIAVGAPVAMVAIVISIVVLEHWLLKRRARADALKQSEAVKAERVTANNVTSIFRKRIESIRIASARRTEELYKAGPDIDSK